MGKDKVASDIFAHCPGHPTASTNTLPFTNSKPAPLEHLAVLMFHGVNA